MRVLALLQGLLLAVGAQPYGAGDGEEVPHCFSKTYNIYFLCTATIHFLPGTSPPSQLSFDLDVRPYRSSICRCPDFTIGWACIPFVHSKAEIIRDKMREMCKSPFYLDYDADILKSILPFGG